MKERENPGGLWLWGTVITIACCILFFVSFAVWTSIGDVELVYDNYYAKDVVFEQQIRRVERTQALRFKPVLNFDQTHEILTLKFPIALGHSPTAGEVLLYRPADLHRDRLFPLNLDGDSLQFIHLPDLDPGLWRIKLAWSSGGLEFYLEEPLQVKR